MKAYAFVNPNAAGIGSPKETLQGDDEIVMSSEIAKVGWDMIRARITENFVRKYHGAQGLRPYVSVVTSRASLRWTEDETYSLRDMYTKGLKDVDISAQLGRGYYGVVKKRLSLGLRRR